tara:strand:+ start:252 stop:941 length:690 start_codon:yes stop_codon:yes gene_type:complete
VKKSLKIFVINLEREFKRRNFLIKHFNNLKINYEIFKAHDSKSLTKSLYSNYSNDLAFKLEGRGLSLDEIACSSSHLSIYKKIVKENIAESIIFEDDIIVSPKLIKFINKIPRHVELINFKSDAKQKKIKLISKGLYLTKFLEIPNRTGAIYLRLTAAKKLLKSGYPIKTPADGLTGRLTYNRQIRGYGIYPELVKLRKLKSTIKGRGSFFLINKTFSRIINYFYLLTK